MTTNIQLKDALLDAGLTGPVEYWKFDHDAVRIVLSNPQPCGICRAASFIFLNRDGRTRCWSCDDQQFPSAQSAKSVDHPVEVAS